MLGPDYVYVLIELAVANLIAGTFLLLMNRELHPTVHALGSSVLILKNMVYLLLSFWNPGLPSRNPSRYNKSYLNKVVILKQHLFCAQCRVVKVSSRETVHCDDCNFCVDEHDHHCPWTSTCVGRGNIILFKLYLGFLMALIVFMFLGWMITEIDPRNVHH